MALLGGGHLSVAVVQGCLAFIGESVAFIGDSLAFIGESLAFLGSGVAFLRLRARLTLTGVATIGIHRLSLAQ